MMDIVLAYLHYIRPSRVFSADGWNGNGLPQSIDEGLSHIIDLLEVGI